MVNKEDIVIFDPTECDRYPNITWVENYLGGIGRLCFNDGTFQFAENETYPEIIYSPRMTESDLENFCKSNIKFYKKYFDDNFDAMGHGDKLPPIEKFWE